MNNWNAIPDQTVIDTTVTALKANGFESVVVENGEEAKAKALSLIPEGSEVMTMTSVTLDTIGLTEEINNPPAGGGKLNAVKPKLYALDPNTQKREQKRMGAAPDFVIGSVHALTQDGKVLIASNTGSQLPAYSYGSDHVIWVVGAQKIAANLEEGMKRIEEYVLPLESERAHKAYGVPGSFISKILIMNREVTPGRITIIIVKESLGF